MKNIKIKIVDAFTSVPYAGNSAGVVLEGDLVSESQMQNIARELNLSETAFILSASKPDADLRIRWFTPASEVPICGHATIASFFALAEEGRLGMGNDGSYHFNVETNSGILPIDIVKDSGNISVMFGLNLPKFERASHFKIDLLRVLNIPQSEFETKIQICRDNYLYVPVKRLHTLFNLKPNFITMSYFMTSRKLSGICVYTTETIDRDSKVHSRFFAPTEGINEDPVTGSANGPLAVILWENGLLDAGDGRILLTGEQGDSIGRKGRVNIELEIDEGKPSSLRIGGSAVSVLTGEIVITDLS